eukprot:85212-Pleurochrysis_carterae.AAC.1
MHNFDTRCQLQRLAASVSLRLPCRPAATACSCGCSERVSHRRAGDRQRANSGTSSVLSHMGRAQHGTTQGLKGAALTRTLPKHLRYAKPPLKEMVDGKRTPSQLAAELKGIERLPATLKRPQVVSLFNMAEFTQNVESVVPLNEPLFQPSPPEVIFDKFEPLQRYTTSLSLRNNDNVNRRIKVLNPDSTAFTIEAPKHLKGGKVAPGIEVVFKVHFFPRAAQDYACELACITEREKFVISLAARGPRACFEFPDGVDFVLQPVRGAANRHRIRTCE